MERESAMAEEEKSAEAKAPSSEDNTFETLEREFQEVRYYAIGHRDCSLHR